MFGRRWLNRRLKTVPHNPRGRVPLALVQRKSSIGAHHRMLSTDAKKSDKPTTTTTTSGAGELDRSKIGHWTNDEFRKFGYEMVDYIADYYKKVGSYPVLSQVTPHYLAKLLPSKMPEQKMPFSKILSDVDRTIIPGITHWQSPNFYAVRNDHHLFFSWFDHLDSSADA